MSAGNAAWFTTRQNCAHTSGQSASLAWPASDSPLLTPAAIVSTLHGLPPHLTPDNFKLVTATAPVSFFVEDIIESEHLTRPMGMKKFTGNEGRPAMLVMRTDYWFGDSDLLNNEKWVSVKNAAGVRQLNTELFNQIATSLTDLDAVVAPFDHHRWPANQKRIRKSVNRSLFYLDALIKARDHSQATFRIFAPIVGSDNEHERILSAEQSAKRKVDGYTIEGGDLRFFQDGDARQSTLLSTLKLLPRDKPVFYRGPASPIEVLRLVSLGIALFDTLYPIEITDKGYALNFDLDCSEEAPLVLDLWNVECEADSSPIQKECKCECCTEHTRAYIHHLLQTREMLAKVLLSMYDAGSDFSF